MLLNTDLVFLDSDRPAVTITIFIRVDGIARSYAGVTATLRLGYICEGQEDVIFNKGSVLWAPAWAHGAPMCTSRGILSGTGVCTAAALDVGSGVGSGVCSGVAEDLIASSIPSGPVTRSFGRGGVDSRTAEAVERCVSSGRLGLAWPVWSVLSPCPAGDDSTAADAISANATSATEFGDLLSCDVHACSGLLDGAGEGLRGPV